MDHALVLDESIADRHPSETVVTTESSPKAQRATV